MTRRPKHLTPFHQLTNLSPAIFQKFPAASVIELHLTPSRYHDNYPFSVPVKLRYIFRGARKRKLGTNTGRQVEGDTPTCTGRSLKRWFTGLGRCYRTESHFFGHRPVKKLSGYVWWKPAASLRLQTPTSGYNLLADARL